MRRIPWWAVASAGAAPVLLIGGFTLAQTRQPPAYDPIRDTISALAAVGATDRWVMTTALAGLGACHLITAAGLRPVRWQARAVLGVGGAATVLVATFPQPAHGNSVAHTVAATVAFIALGTWPALSVASSAGAPLLSGWVSVGASGALLGLVAVVRGRAPRRSAGTRRARRRECPGPVAAGRRGHHPPRLHPRRPIPQGAHPRRFSGGRASRAVTPTGWVRSRRARPSSQNLITAPAGPERERCAPRPR